MKLDGALISVASIGLPATEIGGVVREKSIPAKITATISR